LDDADTNVIFDLNDPIPNSSKSNIAAKSLDFNPADFSSDAVALYSKLSNLPCHISNLARLTNIPIAHLLTAVTELELAEKISAHSGRRYSLPH
jgi:predicted Rossmann fold nucleotide-binding protein DprA/Smf involved in DNA uptake